MEDWNATHYLKYCDERTRAAADLAMRIRLEDPERIADLGCGPGNSTQVLCARWPEADIVGIDNSAGMLESAREAFPKQRWVQADLLNWNPDHGFDLLYSNAALQWVPNHDALVRNLFTHVLSGGALAFQIPSSTFAVVRKLIHQVSRSSVWNHRMDAPRHALTMESPLFYYDSLVNDAVHLDIWETEYNHVMDSKDSIVDWIASTGLRPFLAVLDDEKEQSVFLNQLRERVNDAYESQVDGKVLFPFRRTFVIAYR